jgi:outer membrane protein TolC
LDAVDDARRGVLVAKNNLLPDFDVSGSVAVDTKPGKPNTLEYNTERTTWQGMLELEIPLNRQAERNTFRSALIDLRRAERNHEEFRDQVRVDVRRALRQIALARVTLEIQRQNIPVNEFRRAQVEEFARLGRLGSTRDTIEAEDALRNARNAYAAALSDYRSTILEFLLAAGVLRVGEDGKWVTFEPQP